MDDFNPATVYAYSTWPKGSPNYYALPAMGDALAWAYRKDWFDRPELQAEFKGKHGYDLGVPKTWDELYDMCTFFQGREIDGRQFLFLGRKYTYHRVHPKSLEHLDHNRVYL